MGMICAQAQANNMEAWVLARTGDLVEQNSETLWECGVKNSIFSASVGVKSCHYPVLCGSEKSVANALHKELSDCKPMILIIDECHEVKFDNDDSQYMKIVNELQKRNPKIRIIGMSGSPYRNNRSILGSFWKNCAYRILTEQLIDMGFLTPTIFGFGHDDVQYDLSKWKPPEVESFEDYGSQDLLDMQQEILKNKERTRSIIQEVIELTKDRNAVMITGSGEKHLKEIASNLPKDSWIIITKSVIGKKRSRLLKKVSSGERKYILQIGCLTTGYDEPLIDTSVLLRKVGSLVHLTQLLGRGMRLLKPRHIEKGYVKDNHLVLDYTDTMAEMAQMYENPILDAADLENSKVRELDLITCPACGTENSPHAKRCINKPEDPSVLLSIDVHGVKNYSIDGRCEFFWHDQECPQCKTKNSPAARQCRKCEFQLYDPNKNLNRSHYQDGDYKEVLEMRMRLTKNEQGIIVEFILPEGEKATEVYYPKHENPAVRNMWKGRFLKYHLPKRCPFNIYSMTPKKIIGLKAVFDVPLKITHRVNDKGRSIIAHRVFRSGREENTT